MAAHCLAVAVVTRLLELDVLPKMLDKLFDFDAAASKAETNPDRSAVTDKLALPRLVSAIYQPFFLLAIPAIA
jgi:hypothetical protein